MRTTKTNVVHLEAGEQLEVRFNTDLCARIRALDSDENNGARLEVASDNIIWLQNLNEFLDENSTHDQRTACSVVGVTLHII